MRRWRIQAVALALMCAALMAPPGPEPVRAQSTISNRPVELWVDTRSGQVFIRPGAHRVRLNMPGVISEDQLNREVEEKVQEKTQAMQGQITQQQSVNASLAQQNAALNQQVSEMKPAWTNFADNFMDKFSLGTLWYFDYAMYTHTSFGPQFLTQINQPGPGNELYNSFDLSRAYLNFLFTPTKDITVRVTPNLYRAIGTPTNDKVGSTGAFGSDLDGDLSVRIKYSYVQFNTLFNSIPTMKGTTIKFGVLPNGFVPWEEDLYGYRFVNLTPWNYYSLSSGQAGIAIAGPIKFGEKTYVDYEAGIYDNANFHAFEQSDTKQTIDRLSVYPFGALWKFDGLGITGMYNYGYGNVTPDTASLPGALKGPQSHIERIAALLHYTTETWQLAGEFDYGHNAFNTGNMFSGSGPGDAFGFPTCVPTQTGANTCTSPKTPPGLTYPGWADITTLNQALLNNGRAAEEGFAFFGHYHIPTTPVTIFGMFNWWQPNIHVDKNPFDFQRFVVGVAYQYNEYLRFALDTQNVLYYHSQFAFPVAEALQFNNKSAYTPIATKSGFITGPVFPDMHSIFLNVEFAY
ncbi:MAG TPA: hypothetical protein VGY99_06865 [Candidatus Binataceae bacterium]|jgi:hypothetical protein|nr:hypothetical protein [Candidatus Binataceae bacterium]